MNSDVYVDNINDKIYEYIYENFSSQRIRKCCMGIEKMKSLYIIEIREILFPFQLLTLIKNNICEIFGGRHI